MTGVFPTTLHALQSCGKEIFGNANNLALYKKLIKLQLLCCVTQHKVLDNGTTIITICDATSSTQFTKTSQNVTLSSTTNFAVSDRPYKHH
eukprot:UN07304